MPSIGDFGQEHEQPEDQEDPITFGWFGVPIQVEANFNQVNLVDLMEATRTIDSEDPTAMVIIKDILRVFIRRADFNVFWKLAREKDQKVDDLAALINGLFEAMTDRPTQRPSDSSSGRPITDAKSRGDSPTPVSAGRPDLQLLLEGGAETRSRIAAAAAG